MKAYFDTSAVVSLLIAEPGTAAAGAAWDDADRVVSVRLAHVEARAALAQAAPLGRISPAQHRRSVAGLERLLEQVEVVDIDDELVRTAGELAERHGLRAYDAVHLGAALTVGDQRSVFVAGDRALLSAATAEGLATTATA